MNTERHGKSLISKTFFLPLILLQLLIHEPSLLRLKTTFPCPCDAGIQVQSYFSVIASIVAVKTPDNPAAFVKKISQLPPKHVLRSLLYRDNVSPPKECLLMRRRRVPAILRIMPDALRSHPEQNTRSCRPQLHLKKIS